MRIKIPRPRRKDRYAWRSWYAWRPVLIDWHFVWLERIEIRRLKSLPEICWIPFYLYRFPEGDSE